MRFDVLGPIEVWDDEEMLTVPGPQQRALLAVLLLNANHVVSTDRLVECLWGDEPPATARSLLQGCVSQLRRALRRESGQRLLTRPPGYVLRVGPGELDLHRFEELVAAARAAVDEPGNAGFARADAMLAEALSVWRGPAFDAIDVDVCRAEAERLEQRRLVALEERIDIELRLGRHERLAGELPALVAAHPVRERLWGQLMLARYASDRQAEALSAYRELRQMLVDELGLEPSSTLRQLQRDILAGADALANYLGTRGRAAAVARPARAAPAQLPAATSAFTGRVEHLRWLDGLAVRREAGTPIAVISGTAGVGKTAFAVAWAHRARESFPNGQLYVNLRGHAQAPPVRPIEALAGFLLALGVPADQVPVELDRATTLYRTLVADTRLLVVLDNARSAEQVRPLLPGGAGCLVLVTSRDDLAGLLIRDGAAHLALDVFDPQEAHELLVELLGRDRVDAESGPAAELAALCARLPLALRVAAAHLTLHPERRIADQVAALATGDRLRALGVEGDEDSAVGAAFDLSYAALDPDGRRLFRRYGLVPGPDLTAGAAAALTGTEAADAARLLERLAGEHLLEEPTTGRYTSHDLLRRYAADRARREESADEREAALGRLLDWYLRSADAAARQLYPEKVRLPVHSGPPVAVADPAAALAWLDAERPNLLAAVHYAAEDKLDTAWLLADTLRGYLTLRVFAVDWLAAAQAGLAAAEARGDLRAAAALQLSLADVARLQTRYRLAIGHYREAARLSEATGWVQGQSAALGNLGIAYEWSGSPRLAAEHYRQALAVDRAYGDRRGEATKLGNLGTAHFHLGQLALAATYYGESLGVHRELSLRAGAAISLSGLGYVRLAQGRLDDAAAHLSQALAVHREVGDVGSESLALNGLAQVQRDHGRPAEALELAKAAVARASTTGSGWFEAAALTTVAEALLDVGDQEQALSVGAQALQLAQEAGSRLSEFDALIGLADTSRQLGRHDAALAYAGEAAALAHRNGTRGDEGEALTVTARVRLARGDVDGAIAYGRRALAIHRETGHRLREARTLVLLGHARHQRGDTARGHWRRALKLFTDIGVPEADSVQMLLET